MNKNKKGIDFIQLGIYVLSVGVIAIIAFTTFNAFNNTASSTGNIVKSLGSFEQSDLNKIKIDKKNVSGTYQLKNNIKDSEVLALTLSGVVNINENTLGIGVVGSNMSESVGNDRYNTLNFTEEDKSAPQVYVFSMNKLSQDTKGLTYVGTGILEGSDKTINTFVYKVFDKVNTVLSSNNVPSNGFVADTQPDNFVFNTLTDQPIDQSYMSNEITISGINTGITVSFNNSQCSSSLSSCGWIINGGWVGSSETIINNGDTIKIYINGDGTYGSTYIATITIGSTNYTFSVSTPALLAYPTTTTWIGTIPTEQGVLYNNLVLRGNGSFNGIVFNPGEISSSMGGTISNIHVNVDGDLVFDFLTPNIGSTMFEIRSLDPYMIYIGIPLTLTPTYSPAPVSVNWNGVIPDTMGVQYNGLSFVGDRSFIGTNGLNITSLAGGMISNIIINGDGTITFDYSTPFAPSDTINITGTDQFGNSIYIDFMVDPLF